MKRIKLLQLIGKENRRGIFLKGIKEQDQTLEMKEGYTKEDKTED